MLLLKFPFIAIWMGFDLKSCLMLAGLPFLIGIFLVKITGRKAYRICFWCSLIAAVCLTVLYQFGRNIHAFDWLGFLVGIPATYLFFGLAVGGLFRKRR